MSRLLVTNKSFELLEPYEGKLSRTVLRGESSRKGADLLDFIVFNQSSFLEILLSINQAINISIKQDCRITKINSLVGERPAARGGTTRPDERKNL